MPGAVLLLFSPQYDSVQKVVDPQYNTDEWVNWGSERLLTCPRSWSDSVTKPRGELWSFNRQSLCPNHRTVLLPSTAQISKPKTLPAGTTQPCTHAPSGGSSTTPFAGPSPASPATPLLGLLSPKCSRLCSWVSSSTKTFWPFQAPKAEGTHLSFLPSLTLYKHLSRETHPPLFLCGSQASGFQALGKHSQCLLHSVCPRSSTVLGTQRFSVNTGLRTKWTDTSSDIQFQNTQDRKFMGRDAWYIEHVCSVKTYFMNEWQAQLSIYTFISIHSPGALESWYQM